MSYETYEEERETCSRGEQTTTEPSSPWESPRTECRLTDRYAKVAKVPEGLYPGDYLKAVGQKLVNQYTKAGICRSQEVCHTEKGNGADAIPPVPQDIRENEYGQPPRRLHRQAEHPARPKATPCEAA